MNSEQFLINQGWRKGEGLRPGAIKKPVLVSRKKDNKGLGFDPQKSDGWWERMFDGHLKSLDVLDKNGSGKVSFKIDEEKKKRDTSILYSSFLSGGFINDSNLTESVPSQQPSKNSEDKKTKKSKKSKEKKTKEKKEKKEKKERKEKAVKAKEKIEKKEKKTREKEEKASKKRKRDSETGSKKHKSK